MNIFRVSVELKQNYRIVNKSLEEQEMLWEHKSQVSVSPSLLSSRRGSGVFLYFAGHHSHFWKSTPS